MRCWFGISPASSKRRSWRLSARTGRSKTCERASPCSSCRRRRRPRARLLCGHCLQPRVRILCHASASSQGQGFEDFCVVCAGCHLRRHELSAGGVARTPLCPKSVVHGVLQHHSSMHSLYAEQSIYVAQQQTTTSTMRHFRRATVVLTQQHPYRTSGRNSRLSSTPRKDGWKTSSTASADVQHPLALQTRAISTQNGCPNHCPSSLCPAWALVARLSTRRPACSS